MIKQVKIQQFKSFRDMTIELAPLNILIGANGAGKSNFISFFELLNQLYQRRLGEYVMQHGGADRLLHNGVKNSDSMYGLFNFDNTNAFFFSIKTAVGDQLYVDKTGDYFNNRYISDDDYEKWHCTLWDKSVKESDIISRREWRAGYIQSFLRSFTVYHFHDTSLTSAMRKPCQVEDNKMLRHDASNLPAFLFKLQEHYPRNFAMIEAVVKTIAPYFKRFKLSPSELQPDKINLEWEEMNSDMYLDATNLSDGTLRFIALATLLLQPNPPQTLIIDEPELGLHPSAINIFSALVNNTSLKI